MVSRAFSGRRERVRPKTKSKNALSVPSDRFVCKRAVFQLEPVSRPEAAWKLQVISTRLKMYRLLRELFGIRPAFHNPSSIRNEREISRAGLWTAQPSGNLRSLAHKLCKSVQTSRSCRRTTQAGHGTERHSQNGPDPHAVPQPTASNQP